MVGMSRSQVPVDRWDAAFGCQRVELLERGRQVIGAATNENLHAAPWRQGLEPRLVAQHERGALLFGAQVEGRALHLDHRDPPEACCGGSGTSRSAFDHQDTVSKGSERDVLRGAARCAFFPVITVHTICSLCACAACPSSRQYRRPLRRWLAKASAMPVVSASCARATDVDAPDKRP